MKYRIDYKSRHSEFVEGRDRLLERINSQDGKDTTDIRKVYKTGVTDSVMDKYSQYISKANSCGKIS